MFPIVHQIKVRNPTSIQQLHVTDIHSPDITALSYIIIRLLRTGLLSPPTPSSAYETRSSFFTPIFPSLLCHLRSPGSKSRDPTRRYPPTFWPRLLIELQESDIAGLGWSFLLHLTQYIPSASTYVDSYITHAITALGAFLAPSTRGKGKERRTSEAYEAFVEGLLARGKGREVGGDEALETRCRVIVGWVAEGGDVGMFEWWSL